MDWLDLLAALGLVLIIEGIMPFLNPGAWQRTLEAVARLDARRLRLIGLASMAAGLVILYFARS